MACAKITPEFGLITNQAIPSCAGPPFTETPVSSAPYIAQVGLRHPRACRAAPKGLTTRDCLEFSTDESADGPGFAEDLPCGIPSGVRLKCGKHHAEYAGWRCGTCSATLCAD